MAACIATWSFSHPAVLKAQQLLSTNATSLDAVEEAIARTINMLELNFSRFNCNSDLFIRVHEKGRGTVDNRHRDCYHQMFEVLGATDIRVTDPHAHFTHKSLSNHNVTSSSSAVSSSGTEG